MIDQSEGRQQRELALRLSQVVQDFDAQRRADLLNVEQNFGQLEGQTGAEVAQQRELLNSLVKVSQQGEINSYHREHREHGDVFKDSVGRDCSAMVVAAIASPLAAQVRPGGSAASADQIQARHEIAALEAVLENAVKYGAQMLTEHVQTSTTPQSVLLTGLARARGFRLDGYGVLFDVEFPSIRRSVAWTMRALERPDPELLAAMKELRKNTQAVADPRSKQEMDRAIKALEDQIKAYDAQMKTVSTGDASRRSPRRLRWTTRARSTRAR